MKISILLFTGLMLASMCFGQTQKDTVYLFFDSLSKEKCKIDVEGQGYQFLNKFRKENIENYIIFDICREEFVFVKERKFKDTLSAKEAKKINYSDIDYMISVYNNLRPKQFKHHIYDAIYIVEKTSENTFVKYKVGWIDEQLSWIE